MALFCFVLFIAWLSFGEVHAYSSFTNPEQVRFGCLVSSSGCAQMGDTIINREWYTKVVGKLSSGAYSIGAVSKDSNFLLKRY